MTALYIHIPFCSALCHYCDFAKTANRGGDVESRYFTWLNEELERWLELWCVPRGVSFSSVFFGGGTPGLYAAAEYAQVFAKIRAFLEPGAEISLEANPGNISAERLQGWRELGFNRLSLGVQTFSPAGLRELTRDHDAETARAALRRALSVFPNTNIDLIYGWRGQTLELFEEDLRASIALGIPHLSLYALTIEGRTPFARRLARGAIVPPEGDLQSDMYKSACRILAEHGYDHEEVSNWSKSGFSCRHNWVYWSNAEWIGVGPGAHSYLDAAGDGVGVRFAYERDERRLIRGGESRAALEVDTPRDGRAALLETILCGLRTNRGVDFRRLETLAGNCRQTWAPSPQVRAGLARGDLFLANDRLRLNPREWYRESMWTSAVLDSFS